MTATSDGPSAPAPKTVAQSGLDLPLRIVAFIVGALLGVAANMAIIFGLSQLAGHDWSLGEISATAIATTLLIWTINASKS